MDGYGLFLRHLEEEPPCKLSPARPLRLAPSFAEVAGKVGATSVNNPLMNLTWRYATGADLDLLAEWNHQLIRDECHRNPMTVDQLRTRMEGWLSGGYEAVIFSEPDAAAYALFKREDSLINLRQLFVRRDRRRAGIGRSAFALLRDRVWPQSVRLTVDVLSGNQRAIAFWRSVGYRDFSLTLEIMPT